MGNAAAFGVEGRDDGGAFQPPGWLGNAHVQALGQALPFWAPPAPAGEQRLLFPRVDGDALVGRASWRLDLDDTPCKPALLVHTVAGSGDWRSLVRAGIAL